MLLGRFFPIKNFLKVAALASGTCHAEGLMGHVPYLEGTRKDVIGSRRENNWEEERVEN